VKIPDGWFATRAADLRTSAAGDWGRINEDSEFCVKDGKFYPSIDDARRTDESRRIYNLSQDGSEDPQ
jgi:hypothetical protein